MPNEQAVANALAAAGNRIEAMSSLCQVLSGQIDRQRREFAEIKAAIASDRTPEGQRHAAPSDISPEMLAG